MFGNPLSLSVSLFLPLFFVTRSTNAFCFSRVSSNFTGVANVKLRFVLGGEIAGIVPCYGCYAPQICIAGTLSILS